MNVIDIIIGLFLLLGFVRGMFNGFFSELAGLVALVAGIYGALYLSEGTYNFLATFINWEEKYLSLLAFALTFIIIVVVISLLGRLLTSLVKLMALGLVNRLLGAVFGLLKMAFLASVVFMFLNSSGAGFIEEETKETSVLYGPVQKLAPIFLPPIIEIFHARPPAETPDSGSPS